MAAGALRYAVTPRFAITSSEAQLRAVGRASQVPSRSAAAVASLRKPARDRRREARCSPNDEDYTAVYDRFGLLGPRSFFAHGIHLSERECARLHETGSKVVHCPTSNTFLGSGLVRHCPSAQATRGRSQSGSRTDVGGGTSYSMLATMAEAYKVAMLRGATADRRRAFSHGDPRQCRAAWSRRRGGRARCRAPLPISWCSIPAPRPVLASRDDISQSLEDRLFALALLGDDRAVRATYVAGKRMHQRKITP